MNNFLKFNKTSDQDFSFSYKKAIWIVLAFLSSLLVISLLFQVPFFFWPETQGIGYLLTSIFSFLLACHAIYNFLDIKYDILFKEIKKLPSIPICILSIAFFVCIIPVAEFVINQISSIDSEFLKNNFTKTTNEFVEILNFKIASFIMLCILAPIIEEFIFRGVILRGMLNYQIKPWKAIMFSTFLFGIVHFNVMQFFGAGILAIGFGYIYYRTKSLLLCIFLHFLNNTLSYYTAVKNETLSESIFGIEDPIIIGGFIFSVILLGYSIYKLTENTIKWN